jgi:hypothetical protein
MIRPAQPVWGYPASVKPTGTISSSADDIYFTPYSVRYNTDEFTELLELLHLRTPQA